ncbi:MAG: hypothetical protein FD123_653 [Bacteroidetes bacterium]|nr:MAG: hypothetical protein FD123_653 [Bacteroidota bacterium]
MLNPIFNRIVSVFLLAGCASCGTSHVIKVMSDKSALVQAGDYRTDSLKMTKNPIISEFKSEEGWFSFKIADIDSLGNYMGDIINDGYFTFKYYPDSLVIHSSNNLPLKKEWDAWYCCGYSMQISSDQSIKTVVKKGKHIEYDRKEKAVYVSRNIKRSKTKKNVRRSKTKPTRLTIVFEK